MDKPDQHDREAERIYNLAGVANRPAVLAELLRSAASYADRAIAAHVKDAHLEIREGARAGELVEVMAGKPVAGEWVAPWEGNSAARKFGGSDAVITVWRFPGEQKFHWCVWMLADAGTKRAEEDTAADLQSAMAAADAWARANPRLLDWQMPPASEPAPSVSDRMAEVTAESRERAATPGGFDGEPTVAGLPAGFKYDGKSIVAAVGVVPHVTPAAPTGTCPKCGPVGLDFDDEDNHYCRKCGGAIDAPPTGTARDLKASILALVRSLASRPGVDVATIDKVTSAIATDTALGRLLDGFPVAAPPPPPAEHGAGEALCSHPIERVLPGARGWCIDCGSLFFAGAWESPFLASPAPAVPANGAEGGEVAEVLADLDAIAKRICRVVGGSASHEILDADDEALLMIRTAVEAMARDNERLKRADDCGAGDPAQCRRRIPEGAVMCARCLNIQTARTSGAHFDEAKALRARVAELESRAEEARNDLITELIEGVAEIGCIYGGDVKEPQITGREEVVAGLEKLREMLGGGR